MKRAKAITLILVVSLATLISGRALAQMQDPMQGTLDAAVASYESGRFIEAAVRFYDAYSGATTPKVFQTSEYYLGRSLMRLDLLQPALYFFSRVLNAGAAHEFFLKAAEDMITLKDRLDDHTIIPHYLNEAYSADFAQIPPAVLFKINYTVGAYQFRRSQYESAAQFLQAVNPESEVYPMAQYLMGQIAFRSQQEQQALQYFEEAANTSKGKGKADLQRIYWLSILALARTNYQIGNYDKADELYASVPRFTDDWLDALFEQAWTYFQRNELGRALGNVHTLKAPQFSDRYWPEAWLLSASAYFYSCNFGLAEETVAVFYQKYKPMMEQMEKFLSRQQPNFEIYYNLVANPYVLGQSPLPLDIYNYLSSNPRFKKLKSMIVRMDAERRRIEAEPTFKGGRMGAEILGILTLLRQQLVNITGRFVYGRMKDTTEVLQGFYNQAQLITFEVANAKKQAILTGTEGALNVILDEEALPRPPMPADYKYYHFNGEYWVDELGYYVYTLSQNCPDEGE